MKISYYPGCTLRTKAKELDITARRCAEALGVEMEEIENWQCCGAVYPMGTDEIATKLSAVRALEYAKRNGGKLLTLCSACHNVIKRTNEDMRTNDDICFRANNYLKFEEPYKGETEVLHYLEMLKNVVGFDNIKKRWSILSTARSAHITAVFCFVRVALWRSITLKILRLLKILSGQSAERPSCIRSATNVAAHTWR